MPFLKLGLILLITVLLLGLFSYRLLDVPTGLSVDEASFGYNAALLAQTGRDERGLPHPIFVLSEIGKDWRQPITQYYLALLFKVFSPSVFLLRFSSVLIAVFSIIGGYFLMRKVMGPTAALVGAAVMATAPLTLLQAHLGLDNIMPVPFTVLWLLALWQYRKNRRLFWLGVAAFALGISFYSYKGMRAIAPVWMILTFGQLLLDWRKNKAKPKDLLVFLSSLAPFFLIIPYLERNYAGAILGKSNPAFNNAYDFFLPYLSSFDPSFLFIRGDIVDFHSTGRHGMLLLASAPLIFVGIYAALRAKADFPKFVLLALVAGPLLFGTVGSIHRFSRLLALLPLFALLAGLGWEWLWQKRLLWLKFGLLALIVLLAYNYRDFFVYYHDKYPPTTFNLVGDMDYFKDVARFSREVKRTGLEPVIHQGVTAAGGESMKFFEVVYFGRLIKTIPDDRPPEKGTLLLTVRQQVPGTRQVGESTTTYFILEPN